MSTRITVASQKGGVGKTTVVLNLGAALAEQGKRTLLVDLDPQGGLGQSLARGDTEWTGLADLLMEQCSLEQALVRTRLPGLAILPRGRLDPTDVCEFEQALHRPGVLGRVLKPFDAHFDRVLLDTPAGVGMITRAALAHSHFALLPTQAEPLALRGLAQLLRVVEHVRGADNPELRLLGILPTMVDLGESASLDVFAQLSSGFAGILDSSIPRAAVFAEASRAGLPVGFLAGAPSPEARRFEVLASELEFLIDQLSGKEAAHGAPQRSIL